MNLQEQLTNNRSRSWSRSLIRMLVITIGPSLTIYFISNTSSDEINPIMASSSPLVDALQINMVNVILLAQTALTTPEIDSQNEEIRLIASDRRWAKYTLFFHIILFIYNLISFWIKGDHLPQKFSFLLFHSRFQKDTSFFKQGFWKKDLLCIAIACLWVWSAKTYKLVIKQSARLTHIYWIERIYPIVKYSLLLIVLGIAFFSQDVIIELCFLLLLILLAVSSTKLDKSKTNGSEDDSKMIGQLKWSLFVIILLSQMMKVEEFQTILPDSKNNALVKSIQTIDYVQIEFLFFGVVICVYIKSILKGAKLDFFDAELAGDPSRMYMHIGVWPEGQDIDKDSLTKTYFCSRILNLLHINNEDLYNETAGYRFSFIEKLYNESEQFCKILENQRQRYIQSLNQRKKYRIILHRVIEWCKDLILIAIKTELSSFFLFLMNIYCAQRFLFFKKRSEEAPTLIIFSLLYWNLCSMVVVHPKIMQWLSFILIYPFYIIDIGYIAYRYLIEVDKKSLPNYTEYAGIIIFPLELLDYAIIFMIVSTYSIWSSSEGVMKKLQLSSLGLIGRLSKEKSTNTEPKIKKMFIYLINLLLKKIRHAFRYFPIIMSIYFTLFSINLLNVVLLLFSLFLMWVPTNDKKYWVYFLAFNFFLILIKHISNELFPLEEFNVELIAMIGIVAIENDSNRINNVEPRENSTQMLILFLICYLSSMRFKGLDTNKPKIESELEEDVENPFADFQLITQIQKYWSTLIQIKTSHMIWFYHICLNIVLIYDHKDLLSTILFILECLCLLLHIIMWNKSGKRAIFLIYYSWSVNIFFVLFYAIFRYLLFFLKYSTVNFFLNQHPFILSICKRMIAKEILANERHFITNEYIMNNYYCPLILLFLAIITRGAFIDKFNTYVNREAEEKLKVDINSVEKTKFIEKTRSLEEKEIQFESFEEKGNTEHTIDQINKGNEKKKLSRTHFIIFYLIYFAIQLNETCNFYSQKISVSKIVLLIIWLLVTQGLIKSLSLLLQTSKLFQIISLYIRYFYKRFVRASKNQEVSHNKDLDLEAHISSHLLLNSLYYNCFMANIEKAILRNWWVPWLLRFISLMFYYLCIWLCAFARINMDPPEESNTLLVIFGIKKLSLDEEIVRDEILHLHILLIGMTLEFLFVTFYKSPKSVFSDLAPETYSEVVETLMLKLNFYIFLTRKKCDISKCYKQKISLNRKIDALLNVTFNASDIIWELPDFLLDAVTIENNNLSGISSKKTFKRNFALGMVSIADDNKEEAQTDYDQTNKRSGTTDRFWVYDLFFKQKEKDSLVTIKMDECTTNEDLIVYMYRNRFKYYFTNMLQSIYYIMTRLAYAPILYSVLYNSKDTLAIILMVYIFFLSWRSKRLFTEGIILFSWILVFYLLITFIKLFVEQSITPIMKVTSNFNDSFAYKLIGQSKAETFWVISLWYSINLITFGITPLILYFVSYNLFSIRIKKEQKVYDRKQDSNRVTYLMIDYGVWRKSKLKWANLIYKYIFVETVTLHNYATITLIILNSSEGGDEKNYGLMLGLTATLIFSFYENYSKTKRIKRHIRILNSNEDEGYRKTIFFCYQCLYFGLIVLHKISLYIVSIPEEIPPRFDMGILGLALAIYAMLFRDLVSYDHYQATSFKLAREGDLKRQYSSLCTAYEKNEDKLYNRIITIISKSKIAKMTDELLENSLGQDIHIDLNFGQQSIVDIFFNRRNKMRAEYLGWFKTILLKITNKLLDTVYYNSGRYQHYDLLFLYNMVKVRNLGVLEGNKEVNLNDYFDGHYDFFETELQKLKKVYNLLRENDPRQIKIYEESIVNNSKNLKGLIEDLKRMNNNDRYEQKSMVNLNYSKMREDMHKRSIENSGHQRTRMMSIEEALPTKDLDSLRLSADLLFQNLLIDRRKDNTNSLDTFKKAQRNKGYIICMHRSTKAFVHNITSDFLAETQGLDRFRKSIFLIYLWRTITANLEIPIAFYIIYNHVMYGGLINIFTLGAIIFLILVEEYLGRGSWWNIIYIINLTMIVFERLASDSNWIDIAYLEVLFGDMTNETRLLSVLLLMPLTEQLKNKGFFDKSMNEFESPGQALARLVINNDIHNIVDRLCSRESKKDYLSTDLLLQEAQKKMNMIDFARLKLEVIKYHVLNYKIVDNFKELFYPELHLLMLRMKNEIYFVLPRNLKSFLYRNFSYRVRKEGGDYYPWIAITLGLNLIYILGVFPRMSSKDNGYFNFIINKEANMLTSMTIINFSYYLSALLIEFLFSKAYTHDLMGYQNNKATKRLIANLNVDVEVRVKRLDWKDKLRNAMSKLKIVIQLSKSMKKSPEKTYHSNPLLYHYIFLVFSWIYLNLNVFFWHPFNTNKRREEEGWIDKFVCTEKEKKIVNQLGHPSCLPYLDNYESKIFYALNITYILLSILQVKRGKKFLLVEEPTYKSIVDKLKNSLEMNLPMIREASTTLEYCSIRTCLTFSEFLLLKDIRAYMHSAKIKNIAKMKNPVGREINRFVQIIMGFGIGIVTVLSITVPLLMFSISTTNTSYKINQASLDLSIVDSHQNKIETLFRTDKMLQNFNIESELLELSKKKDKKLEYDIKRYELLEKETSIVQKLQRNEKGLDKYDMYRFKKITFSTHSDRFLKATPKIIDELKTYIRNNKDIIIMFNLTIQTEDGRNPDSTFSKKFNLKEKDINQLLSIMSSGCQPPDLSRESEIFMFVIPPVLQLKKNTITPIETSTLQGIKVALSMGCSDSNKDYIWITDTSQMRTASFYVVSKKENGLVEFLKGKISSDLVSMKNIYSTIFIVIGLSLLRGMFFGSTTRLWHEHIPRPEILLLLMTGIEQARQEDDLVKEEMLFLFLMDIMRNPEKLRSITDSVLSTRTDQFLGQLKMH